MRRSEPWVIDGEVPKEMSCFATDRFDVSRCLTPPAPSRSTSKGRPSRRARGSARLLAVRRVWSRASRGPWCSGECPSRRRAEPPSLHDCGHAGAPPARRAGSSGMSEAQCGPGRQACVEDVCASPVRRGEMSARIRAELSRGRGAVYPRDGTSSSWRLRSRRAAGRSAEAAQLRGRCRVARAFRLRKG